VLVVLDLKVLLQRLLVVVVVVVGVLSGWAT
jgi:hypothetical protein